MFADPDMLISMTGPDQFVRLQASPDESRITYDCRVMVPLPVF